MKLSKTLIMVPVMVFSLSVFGAVASAHDSPEHDQTTKPLTLEQQQQAKQKALELREKARLNIEQKRLAANGDLAKKKAERAQKCEGRKKGMETKVANLNKNGNKHLTHFNEVYAKVLQYKKDKNLNPEGIDALITAADAAKAKAEASTAALAELKPTVDCSKETVASDLAAFKEAAATARSDLHAYKKAIKDVMRALKQANGDPAKPTESGTGQ